MAGTDTQRKLTERGRHEVAETGRWLARLLDGRRPDRALVSTAERTRATWVHLAEAAGWSADVADFDYALYGGEYTTVLDLIEGTDDSVELLVVVGHNPLIAQLAQLLQDGEGEPEAAAALTRGYPPGTVTVFEGSGAWKDGFSGRLVGYFTPAEGPE
jgi:phosphohistidine phosphatase